MHFIVEKKDSSQTLLAFLRSRLSSYPSVKAIKRAIEKGKCRINGKIETFSTHLVDFKDSIDFDLAYDFPRFSLEILYEDQELIAYNKPPGIPSEKVSSFFLVHRLDKNTSGLIVFAKTQKMKESLTLLFMERKIRKTYLALCDGEIKEKEWIVDNFLEKKASYQGGAIYGKAPEKRGKRAITRFELIKANKSASYVRAFPETGRTHQIRVHLKEKRNPVLGDIQYAQSFANPLIPQRQMLHSSEISFFHPNLKDTLILSAPLFSDFSHTLEILFGGSC